MLSWSGRRRQEPSHLLGDEIVEKSEMQCSEQLFVFLAAELKEKLQSEMEKNAQITEVCMTRKCHSACVVLFPLSRPTALEPHVKGPALAQTGAWQLQWCAVEGVAFSKFQAKRCVLGPVLI